MNAAELLNNSLSPDQATRESATAQLEAAARDNFHPYMHTLAAELANESSQLHTRRAAGLAFKNQLAARNTFNQSALTDRWLALPDSATAQLKESLLSTLGSPQKQAGAVAAQCVSAVAAIELPAQKWSELIPRLLEFVSNTGNIPLRVNTLQAVGYVCEVISPEILATRSNEILTAVVQGARREEPVAEVQQAAVHALYNSLEFIRDNFEREGERNYIMQVVCEATQNQSVPVQVAAFECLVKIMSLYYEKMDFYMEQALFGLTILGMNHQEEAVALQAIEFWSTVCEEEIDLAIEAQEALSYGDQPLVQSHQFARLAASQILPVLLELLTQQEEDVDEEEWTKAMAAASCLELLARDIGDEIVPNVVPFVEAGITQGEWQRREAAVMAFGAVLDGPEPATLAPLVTQALGTLINMMQNDPSIQVRDTVAWTLSKISEVMLEVIDTSMHLENLVSALVVGLGAQPRIITSCCSALSNLVVQLSQPPENGGDEVQTCPMSPYFSRIVQTLMTLSEKPTNEGNCRSAAYSTISTFITSSANDTLNIVQDIAVAMIARQEALMQMQGQLVGLDDRNNWNDMQIQICVVLQSVINKSPPMVAPFADRIMTNLLGLISSAGRTSGVLEDAYATVGALSTALEAGFNKYLEAFTPFLFSALRAYEDWQVAQAAVFAVSDVSRSVNEAISPYTEQVMVSLVELLRSPQIVRSVKPHAVTAMGELAMAVGSAFNPFLGTTMEILSQAGASAVGSYSSDADIEFVWNMREAIVDAFIGILNGLKAADPSPFLQFVPGIMTFLSQCWNDDERTEAFSVSVLGLIGDFADTFKSAVKEQMMQDWVQSAISTGRARGVSKQARQNALYAQKAIKEIK